MPFELPPQPHSETREGRESVVVPEGQASVDQSKILSLSYSSILQGRLHPMTMVLSTWNAIRRLLIPAIPLLVFGNRAIGAFVLGMLFVLTIARALVRYFTFSYRIEAGELIIRQGILERTERHIRLERVQEIQIEQGVLHRIFGVVDANVETGGGQGPEASLSVLSRAEAERLRQAVFEGAAASKREDSRAALASTGEREIFEPEIFEPEILRRLSIGDLVRAGLTSNHLISALVLVGALWGFVDDIVPDSIYERIARSLHDAASQLLEQGASTAVIVALASIVLIFVVSALFSIIGSIALFYGFTFSRVGEDLHRSYGLLTRRSSSLPRRRIQVLEIEEKMLRRLFGLATLRADTVGSRAKEPEENKQGRDVLVPVLRRDEAEELLPVFFPDLGSDVTDWRRVSRLAIKRGTIKGAAFCVAIAAALFFYQRSVIGLWPLLTLPLVYWVNVTRYYNLGYALGKRYFRTRRGWLGRSTHIVPIRKAQVIEVRQTIFDRRLGLATLVVDTAGQAYTGGGPRISNLPVEEARAVAETLAHRAAATEYKG